MVEALGRMASELDRWAAVEEHVMAWDRVSIAPSGKALWSSRCQAHSPSQGPCWDRVYTFPPFTRFPLALVFQPPLSLHFQFNS